MSFPSSPNEPGAAQQPNYAQPVVQQPSAPFAPSPPPGRRNTKRVWTGVAVLAAGVIGGIALLALTGSSTKEAAENLARAPIGCTTTLDFDSAGTFTIYVETKGSIGEVRGDCSNTDADYDFGDGNLPDVELTLLDDNDDEIDLDDDASKSYDAGGFKGESIFTVAIDDPGAYTLTVESEDNDFAIAVGKNPEDAAGPLGILGLALVALGVILGVLLIVFGMKRKPAPPSGGEPFAPAAPVAPAGYTPAPGYVAPPTYLPPAEQIPPAPPSGPGWSPPSS